MEAVNNVSRTIDAGLQQALANPYLMAVLKVTLVLYAAQIAPRLPNQVSVMFQNTYVKMALLFLIIYLSERDFQLAIVLAVLFVIGANYLSGRQLMESFSGYSSQYQATGSAKLIEPKTAIYPGCEKLTMADLEQAFDGDAMKLQTTVMQTYQDLLSKTKGKSAKEALMKIAYAVGLPHNIKFDDESAPYIATLLMYHGFAFGSCSAPQ